MLDVSSPPPFFFPFLDGVCGRRPGYHQGAGVPPASGPLALTVLLSMGMRGWGQPHRANTSPLGQKHSQRGSLRELGGWIKNSEPPPLLFTGVIDRLRDSNIFCLWHVLHFGHQEESRPLSKALVVECQAVTC